ncbi:Endoglucanase S [Streptomyces sp. enrichment culture]|uniref:GH12 family glycosyl hydrolase domain-containing protein n=1 Tax=Streptomyces sp. enrichment culture TaxID=1795815 RepID=UPI0021869DC7|nr:endo-1,4-beta-glucanase [Streptomyces radiopugnans]
MSDLMPSRRRGRRTALAARTARIGTAVAAALAVAASLTAASTASAAPSPRAPGKASAKASAGTCDAFGTIPMGKYYVNNNLWGQDSGQGWQCAWDTHRSGDTIGWGTEWQWSGVSHEVKSFTSAVLGWHWGWQSDATELPVRLSDNRSVRTSWRYAVSPDPGTMNVAYDLWLHDRVAEDWEDQPTDEVMIWTYRSGGAGPLGRKTGTVNIGGATWDLYQGDIGWKVHSFVRTSNTTSVDLDLNDFLRALQQRGSVSPAKYLSSVQAGTEVFTGAGRLDTSAYSVDVG